MNDLIKLADSYGVTLEFLGRDHGIVRITSQAGTRITISNIALWDRWSHYLDSIIRVIKLLSEDVEEENEHDGLNQQTGGDRSD